LNIWSVEPDVAKTQVVYLVVGFAAMMVFQAVNYAKLGRIALPFYILSLCLVVMTVLLAGKTVAGVGVPNINGAHNWIRIGPASIQPAELMKVSFIMLMARYLRYRESQRTITGLLIAGAIALVPMAAILKQPDLGTCLVFIPTTIAMLFAAGARVKHFAALALIGLVMGPLLWLSGQKGTPVLEHGPSFVRDYQRERVYAMFKTDDETLKATGYQQYFGLAALGSGGFSGKGPGNVPVARKVPESQNDMIFVVIGEQFGFVGSAVVLCAYIVLFVAGLEVATNTKEPFGRLVAVGVVAALAGQTFLNLAVALKLMPVTGVTLPFISSGGSSLIASFMAVGLLLNVGQNRPYLFYRESFDFE
ncbi:MAG: FtsW/RodA/SpoVE family cell cycle protein, partial [Planctomycetota bacterium]